MTNSKLVFIDIDGTLADENHIVPQSARNNPNRPAFISKSRRQRTVRMILFHQMLVPCDAFHGYLVFILYFYVCK